MTAVRGSIFFNLNQITRKHGKYNLLRKSYYLYCTLGKPARLSRFCRAEHISILFFFNIACLYEQESNHIFFTSSFVHVRALLTTMKGLLRQLLFPRGLPNSNQKFLNIMFEFISIPVHTFLLQG